MHYTHQLALARLRAEEIQQQACDARMIAGHGPRRARRRRLAVAIRRGRAAGLRQLSSDQSGAR